MPAKQTLKEALVKRTDVSSGPTTCHLWTGCRNEDGYGQLTASGKRYSAHRAAWIVNNGPIPDGLHVCHKCDNPPCVNINHLFLGTIAENGMDKVNKNRHNPCRLEKNGRSKVDRDDAWDIRILSAFGARTADLARHYNIGWTTVDHILAFRTWKEIS